VLARHDCQRSSHRRGPPELFALYFLAFASFVGIGGTPPVKTKVPSASRLLKIDIHCASPANDLEGS
jgi:hypothetical protein